MAISTDMLQAFVQVADHRSVSAAAAALGVGKSVVSKRVALLEAALKATLFSRSTRKVALTPAGEAYLDFARRTLAELSSGEERLRDLRSELSGLIRVTAPVSWGQHVLARRLPDFLKLHPGVEVELQLADRLMDIAHERIDLAMRWSVTPPAADLSAVPVADVAWVTVASPDYLAQAGPLHRPEDLTGHPCLGYWREAGDDHWVLSQHDDQRAVKVGGRYHANNAESVAAATEAGLGVGLLPDYLCTAGLARGTLRRVLPDWTPQTRFGTRITALAVPERMRFARNQALLGFLRQSAARATGPAVSSSS